ncbi:ATP-binding protein [Candidatus Omnitrophota bacterium]
MLKAARIFLIGLLLAVWEANACATPPETSSEPSVSIVFIVTVIVAVVLALLLFHFARKESAKDLALKRSITVGPSGDKRPIAKVISEEISSQIEQLPSSGGDRQKITGTIVNIVNTELKKRTEEVKAELSQKYEEIVEEKKQTIITVQKKYKNVVKEKQQTESVVRSIAEGLVVVDAKGNVLLMNPAAEKLLGVQRKKKIGKPLMENIKDEQLISLVKDTAKGNREIELTSQNAETKRILRSSSAVIEDEDGKTVGMVAMLSDVTKQRELEKLKSDFVSKVSHELRTPIAIIQNSLAVMLEQTGGSLSEIQEKFLTIIKRNLERLHKLINDVLDLSKLEERKMVLKPEPCSMDKIIEDVCESMSAWAKTKAIGIEKLVQNNLPQAQIDQLRIIQIFNNIVGNAIKFTPRNGKITIKAQTAGNNQEILISVTDTGVGIDKEDLPKVFDKFQQVGERTWTDIGGTGLGLSIAKEIVELHHGRIWVESEKGQGTTFFFTLPVV